MGKYKRFKILKMIIGVSGKINSGKDTVGKIIQSFTNFPNITNERVAELIEHKDYADNNKWKIKKFAEKLKQIVCLLTGCTMQQLEDRTFKEKELGPEWWFYISKFKPFEMYSYLEHKESLNNSDNYKLCKTTPRRLLQILGTEAGRKLIHPNIWVNALMADYKQLGVVGDNIKGIYKLYPNWIITDVRFPNEVEVIKRKDGFVIRTNRNSTDNSYHESEIALDDYPFTYELDNNGSILNLVKQVKEILTVKNII